MVIETITTMGIAEVRIVLYIEEEDPQCEMLTNCSLIPSLQLKFLK